VTDSDTSRSDTSRSIQAIETLDGTVVIKQTKEYTDAVIDKAKKLVACPKCHRVQVKKGDTTICHCGQMIKAAGLR
jgi:ribosomal protein L37AE/L43A